MRWAVAVSPHLDDAVFSAGATIAALASAGWWVRVVTCFTTSVPDPSPFALSAQLDKGLGPELDYMALRRDEDVAACGVLGAQPLHLPLPEAPHRGYTSARDLFAGVHDDDEIVEEVRAVLAPQLAGAQLVLAPQAIGDHVDHRIVADAVAALVPQAMWWRDTPYVLRRPDAAPWVGVPAGSARAIDITTHLAAKIAAVCCYTTQLGFQFGGVEQVAPQLRALAAAEAARVAGFIGSTVASACLDAGIEPVLLDDLSVGRREFVADRVFYEGGIADAAVVNRVVDEHPDLAAVVHCAARIVVPHSLAEPLMYYDNNVVGTLRLVQHLLRRGVHRFVFSSSASIYQPGADLAVDEHSPLAPSSPYARTKAMTEQILADVAEATDLRLLSLRYFNPVGADPQLRTGLQIVAPTHALGQLITAYTTGRPFTLTGTDWPTRDGSAIRDFVHVWDLAHAHVLALQRFDAVLAGASHLAINLGTGNGTTVRELIRAFQDVTRGELTIVEAPPRPGDVVGCYTRSTRAVQLLHWCWEKDLTDGVRDALAWTRRRPSILGV
jgi:UDP-glucose 4-epimerase